MPFHVSEALCGDGNEIAHIDLLIGDKNGPVGVAFTNALCTQSQGHSGLLAVLAPNLGVKPVTVMITKGAKQAVQMFGPAQYAVAKAVADSVEAGVIPKDQAESLCIVCGVFIHWDAADDKKIFQYNYDATKLAIARAMKNEPSASEMLAKQGHRQAPLPTCLSMIPGRPTRPDRMINGIVRILFMFLCLFPAISAGDDTDYLQGLLDNRSKIPSGSYFVDPDVGLSLVSNSVVDLKGVTINATSTDRGYYHILNIWDVSNVVIINGTVFGERDTHLSDTGEWGMGIDIRNSNRVQVFNTKIYDCWGDGIYITENSANIVLSGVTCDGNRRQGISVTDCTNLVISNCTLSNTEGTKPACGIDIEPNLGESVVNCTISNCSVFGNAGGGIQVCVRNVDIGLSFCSSVNIIGNRLWDNGIYSPPIFTIQVANSTNVSVSANVLSNNRGIGIGVLNSQAILRGNQVSGQILTSNKSDAGILVAESVVRLFSNRVVGNSGYGLFKWKCVPVLSNNTFKDNTKGNN